MMFPQTVKEKMENDIELDYGCRAFHFRAYICVYIYIHQHARYLRGPLKAKPAGYLGRANVFKHLG